MSQATRVDITRKKTSVRGSSRQRPEGADDSGFFEDRTGDPYNLTYGSLHRHSIPQYRSAGYQRVVGLGRTQKIVQGSKGNTCITTGDQKDSDVRARAHSLLAGNVDRNKPSTQVVPEGATAQARDAELQLDFLTLSGHGSRKRRRLEAQQVDQNNGEQDSIPPRPPLSQSGSENSDSDKSSDALPVDSFDQFRHDTRQQRRLELSRAVRDHPQDIEAWLALVKHQDDILDPRDGASGGPTNAERHALADVKISIYETALSKNTTNAGRDLLILGLMDEGAKIWDAKKLASQWRIILKANSQSQNLWIKYLDFEQSHFPTFTHDQCKSVYAECLKIAAAQPANRHGDQLRIYMLLRLTAFMKGSGYSEHAVALWQAMLEYNFFHPDAPESSLENFWNSEVARIGEDGARGWRSGSDQEMLPTSETSKIMIDSTRLFQSWRDCEKEQTLNASLPARTLDEVNDNDPYRVIISSDISEQLFRVIEPADKVLLLNGFLCFCSLPPLLGPDLEQRWWTDSFLRNPNLSLIDTASEPRAQRDVLIVSPIINFVTDTSTMFADPGLWFSCWQHRSPSDSRLESFQKLALRQLADALPELDHLADYVIAYQLKYYAKEARKIAKALLKQRPSNLRLYNAYALVECRLGNLEAAERVWSTALAMSSTSTDNNQQIAILLWRTWVWQLLDRAEPRKALALLLAIPGGQVDVDKLLRLPLSTSNDVHSTAVLKARRHLESNLAQATSLHHTELTCDYSDLLALLHYLTSTYSLTTAMTVYSKPIKPLTSTSNSTSELYALELLHQSRARIIHLHARLSTSFRPSDITSPLAESVRRFPNNTIFLSLYHQYTQRSLLTDRIRTVLPTLRSSSSDPVAKDSIVPAVYEIWSEMNRPSYAGTTTHSVRAAFERALEPSRAGSHSLALWTWYLRWELKSVAEAKKDTLLSTTMAKLSRPQDIFYRGMRSCPWAKEFYMLAFTHSRLADAIGVGGLSKIYETMVEKGLRVHVDLGESLEGLSGGRER